MTLVVDGYNDGLRGLVDIPDVRVLLQELYQQWPYWAFFLNQVDDSIKLLGSCICGTRCPGSGAVEIDGHRVEDVVSHTTSLLRLAPRFRHSTLSTSSKSSGWLTLGDGETPAAICTQQMSWL